MHAMTLPRKGCYSIGYAHKGVADASVLRIIFTGKTATFSRPFDQNLTCVSVAMAKIGAVRLAPGDTDIAADKSRASAFAIFGTVSAPMAAGAMLLMFNLAIALFIGLGPIFILCLLFEQTKSLFCKWLMYGIGTLFAMGMLSFVSSVVLKVTLALAEGLWASSVINGLLGVSSESLTTQSMEQGGIGLLMTLLIISAPPMAAQFFNGTLGSFMAYSAFSGGGSRPGPQGQPAGSYAGGGGHGPAPASTVQDNSGRTGNTGFANNSGVVQPRQPAATDPGIRTNPQFGNAPTTTPPNN